MAFNKIAGRRKVIMVKLAIILTMAVLSLSGCSSSQGGTTDAAKSSDWTAGYNYASGSWDQPGFRSLMGVNGTKTSMCNYITQSAITGFNPMNGFQNETESEFYDGCIQFFTEQGY
jgi:hypothetical protein